MGALLDWLLVAYWAGTVWAVSSVPGSKLPPSGDCNELLLHVGHWLGFA